MITNLAIFLLVIIVVVAVSTFVSLRRQARGPVFTWIAPQAGLDPSLWSTVYWVAKLFFALVPSVSLLLTSEGSVAGVAAIISAVTGFFVPDLILLLARRWRRQKIERSLSFFLDLMVSLLRAGLPVEEAFSRAGTRGLPPGHPLAEEVTRTASDLGAGVERTAAYRGFADRTGVHDVRPMASALDLGGRLGFGVADILAAHADLLRDKRMENGRQRIDRTMIAALVPVMLCGLPLMLVVVIVPIAVDIGRTLQLMRSLF